MLKCQRSIEEPKPYIVARLFVNGKRTKVSNSEDTDFLLDILKCVFCKLIISLEGFEKTRSGCLGFRGVINLRAVSRANLLG